ncbi:armadillo-type protein [Mycena rebaudengoi]|nr:armadillo-type protein [Mycena rebaudengoi]
MLGNASPNVRYSALDSLCTLVKHDDFRAEISTPARIHLITDMLWDSKPALRESGLKTVCTLISFGDVSTGINTPQIIHQVAAMLEDSEPGVRKHALAAVPGFIPFDDKHAMSAPQALQNIAGMIDNSGLRLSSHKALAALLQHEHVRMVDLAREIRHRVVSTLGEAGLDVNLPLLRNDAIRTALLNEIDLMLGITDSEQRIRFGALEGIIALVKDDEFRGEISTQTICKIADMIDDSNTSVRISALRAVIALVPYEISATILTPQTIAKITAGLEDSAGAVKKTALKAVAALLPFDDFRVILTFQNFQHILKLLRTSHSHKPGSLMFTYGVDLLNHHSSRALVSSRNSLVYVLDMLNGSPEDDGILLFMKSFIANYNDITPIGYILTQEILLRIVGANPNVRKSYIQITMMLNFSRIPMASDDTQQLMRMLHNSDPDIVQSAAVIMGTVIANDECRQTATRSGLGRMTLKLIQHLRTAISGLELIRAFAKYDDTRHALTDSPGVVHQLLSMLKSGTTDIDRWEVGVKGLLALGLL